MTYILHKVSAPGFAKPFATHDEARVELLKRICGDCLMGRDSVVTEGCKLEQISTSKPDPNDMFALLQTPCGLEYMLEHLDPMDDSLRAQAIKTEIAVHSAKKRVRVIQVTEPEPCAPACSACTHRCGNFKA